MNINVPAWARGEFWDEPPEGAWEFWSFRFPPPCKVGDPITFRFDGVTVATAVVAAIEKPGQSRCEHSGRFGSGWKVFWNPADFKDLRRTPTAGGLFA